MKKPVIIIGVGEMGGVFARAFLKAGHPVYPVSRQTDMQQLANKLDAECVVVATGEADLQKTLSNMPKKWLKQCVLLQNELLPNDWQKHAELNATVISVWFEKKPRMDFKVIVPSPIFGEFAETVSNALNTMGIHTDIKTNLDDMTFELVRKNVYILASNICGLEVQGNVGELAEQHAELLDKVIEDILKIQQHLTSISHDKTALLKAVETAFNGDKAHKCMGRSAPDRLQRALDIAQSAHLEVNELKRISANYQ